MLGLAVGSFTVLPLARAAAALSSAEEVSYAAAARPGLMASRALAQCHWTPEGRAAEDTQHFDATMAAVTGLLQSVDALRQQRPPAGPAEAILPVADAEQANLVIALADLRSWRERYVHGVQTRPPYEVAREIKPAIDSLLERLAASLRRFETAGGVRPVGEQAPQATGLRWKTLAGRIDGWSDLHVVAADRFRIGNDETSGSMWQVARVEVRPGDKVNGWSGERAEVSGMCDGNGRAWPVMAGSGHEFYALAVKVAPDWSAPEANAAGYRWGTCFQLHGPDSLGASPSFALMVEGDFHVDVCGGDVFEGGVRKSPRGPVALPFSDGALHPGQWNEFLIEIGWAADETGRIVVWRRTGPERAWQTVLTREHVATLQYRTGRPVGPHYWKAGFYRSESSGTNLLWLGPIARGPDRERVIAAAFGGAGP